MQSKYYNHYVVMFFIMIISGLITRMNAWADKPNDIKISLNDVYLIFLMSGWMLLFMGIFYKSLYAFLFGLALVICNNIIIILT